MDDFDAFIDSLIDDELPTAQKPAKEREKHTCQACSGTGQWHRVNKYGNSNCIQCQGRGFFYTSPEHRAKAKAQRVARKAAARTAGVAEFDRQNPGLYAALKSYTFSEFAQSLAGQIETRGYLSDKQLGSARSMQAKMAARDEAKAEQSKGVAVDLQAIVDMFDTAVGNGHKKPSYRAEGLVISKAPMNGVNAGALYVKRDGEYQGKVVDGEFKGVRDTHDDTRPALQAIAQDPLAAALRWGQKFGICSCCGRELTNPESIAAGIGPVCAANFGWG